MFRILLISGSVDSLTMYQVSHHCTMNSDIVIIVRHVVRLLTGETVYSSTEIVTAFMFDNVYCIIAVGIIFIFMCSIFVVFC